MLRVVRDDRTTPLLDRPASLLEQDIDAFDAVFIPGGHGAVWDLADSNEVAQYVSSAWKKGKVIASVCHGPAALVGVGIDGVPIVKGKKVAAFTDSEERSAGLQDVVPFLLESRLRELGAEVQAAPDMQPNAVADGNLITGQNPMSSAAVAELLVQRLG